MNVAQILKSSKRKLHPGEMLFKYSSYWRTWSRVIAPRGSLNMPYNEGSMVEVDLTPINGWNRCHVERVRAINIRKHGTQDDRDDKYVTELPPDVLADMEVHLDHEVVEALMDPTLIDQIDWKLYGKHCNGGCPIALCRKVDYREAA